MRLLALPVVVVEEEEGKEVDPLVRNATNVANTGTSRAIVLKEAGLVAAMAVVVVAADMAVVMAAAAVVVVVVVVAAARHATRAVAMATCRETAPRARSATLL
jgi:hypothetical protein